VKLDNDMREELILAMQAAFTSIPKLRSFVEYRLDGQDPDDFFPLGSSKREGLDNLVRHYNGPGNIEVLAAALRESEQARGPRLGPVLEHIAVLGPSEVPWEAPQDPFDAFFVSGGRPFIDRSGLRDHLRASLKLGNGPRVVVISGTRPCGKTWSWHFLTFLEGKLEGFRTAKIDLAKLTPPPTPLSVMQTVALRLGLEEPRVDRTAAGSTQARHLVDWFAGRLKEGKARYIVTLDSLDHSRLPDETEDLIDGLALEAADQGDPPGFVLVLLGPKFEINVDTFVLGQEEIPPLEEDHVRTYLDSLGQHLGKPLPPEAIDQVVASAFANPPSDRIEAMDQVSRQVARFARNYFSPSAAT
jgi:hypothetical protein